MSPPPRAGSTVEAVIIGLDVGGTKALGLLVDPSDRRIETRVEESSAGSGDELVLVLSGMVGELRRDHEISAVGLGISGLVDRDGTVRYSPNLPDLVEFPMAARLRTAIGLHVRVANDATTGAWAEARLGAGRGSDDFAYVALGTGIGAGFVVNGRPVLGAHGFAGEVGHMVVNADGSVHITGQQGPWEYYASGNALGRLGREEAGAGRFPAAIERVGSPNRISGHHVVELMRDGDPDAMVIFDGFLSRGRQRNHQPVDDARLRSDRARRRAGRCR